MSIGQTIARIAGKPAAMERNLTPDEVVRRFGDDVWRFVSSKLNRREDAEDVVMEVYQVAFQNMHRLRSAESPRMWLLVVARRKVIDHIRRNYRRSELPLESAMEQSTKSEDNLRFEIKDLMNRLTDDHRDALRYGFIARVFRRRQQTRHLIGQVPLAHGPSQHGGGQSHHNGQ